MDTGLVHSVVCPFTSQLLLVLSWPWRDGTLSWRWYAAAIVGIIQTHDFAIALPALYHSAMAYRIFAIWSYIFVLSWMCTSSNGCVVWWWMWLWLLVGVDAAAGRHAQWQRQFDWVGEWTETSVNWSTDACHWQQDRRRSGQMHSAWTLHSRQVHLSLYG